MLLMPNRIKLIQPNRQKKIIEVIFEQYQQEIELLDDKANNLSKKR